MKSYPELQGHRRHRDRGAGGLSRCSEVKTLSDLEVGVGVPQVQARGKGIRGPGPALGNQSWELSSFGQPGQGARGGVARVGMEGKRAGGPAEQVWCGLSARQSCLYL